MSRLAELIRELCPDGVEYRPLGEIGCFVRGGGLQKTDFVELGKPCVHYGQIHTRFGIFTEEAVASVSDAQYNRLKRADHGDLLIATTSEDDEAVGKATAWLGSGEVAISGDMFYFRHSLDPKYVSYFFASSLFQEQKRPYLTGAKVRRISDKGLSRVRIPVPPLEVQREIVRILDRFTTLEAELEAKLKEELEARRTQYEHYRNHLLSYDSLAAHGPVEMVELGSVVTLLDSRRIPLKKGDRVSGEYPYYGASGIVDYVDSYIFDEDLLLVSEDGANLKARTNPIAFSASGRVWVNNHAHVLKVDSPLYQKFLEEYLNSLDLEPYLVGSTQPKLNQSGLLSIPVPLPTERVLERSVLLLEKLKLLVTDFSSGLPAEIAARRAQYEHYRDRLLSFPEKVVSVSDAS